MTQKIAIQGEPASFHDLAARKFFAAASRDEPIQLVSGETFAETFAALNDSRADYAICAIENSLYGSINEVYDLLVRHHSSIVGEVYLRVEQCLLGLPSAQLGDVREVHSHPVALAQCEDFLDKKLPQAKRFESHDTAASAAMVAQQKDVHLAAIASRQAAELHGLEVLADSIETNHQNYTRFVVLQPAGTVPKAANKTSLILQTSHQPSALYQALGAFARRNLNLSKLQSRPLVGKAWHYIFYVDVEAGMHEQPLREALDQLATQQCEVTVLGSYTAGSKT